MGCNLLHQTPQVVNIELDEAVRVGCIWRHSMCAKVGVVLRVVQHANTGRRAIRSGGKKKIEKGKRTC